MQLSRICCLTVAALVVQDVAAFGPSGPTPYPSPSPTGTCTRRITNPGNNNQFKRRNLDRLCPGWDDETDNDYHVKHAVVTWDGGKRSGGHCGGNTNLDLSLQRSIANGLFGGSDDVPENVDADGNMIYINDVEARNQKRFVGADGSDFYAQAFIASDSVITEFAVWLNKRNGNGGLRLSIANDDGNGQPDVSSLLYEGNIIYAPDVGDWVYESGLSLAVTVGEQYHVLVDGYQNAGATGRVACGLGRRFPRLVNGFIYSNDGGNTWESDRIDRRAMSIRVLPGTITRDCSAYCILNSEGTGYFKFDAKKKCFRYRRQGKMCGNDAERNIAERIKDDLCNPQPNRNPQPNPQP